MAPQIDAVRHGIISPSPSSSRATRDRWVERTPASQATGRLDPKVMASRLLRGLRRRSRGMDVRMLCHGQLQRGQRLDSASERDASPAQCASDALDGGTSWTSPPDGFDPDGDTDRRLKLDRYGTDFGRRPACVSWSPGACERHHRAIEASAPHPASEELEVGPSQRARVLQRDVVAGSLDDDASGRRGPLARAVWRLRPRDRPARRRPGPGS